MANKKPKRGNFKANRQDRQEDRECNCSKTKLPQLIQKFIWLDSGINTNTWTYLDNPGHTWKYNWTYIGHTWAILDRSSPAVCPLILLLVCCDICARPEIEPQKLYGAAARFIAQLKGFALHCCTLKKYLANLEQCAEGAASDLYESG